MFCIPIQIISIRYLGTWMLELVAESLTQDRNDLMDSVHVGKAVFVKEELHNPGNRTQDLLLSGEN